MEGWGGVDGMKWIVAWVLGMMALVDAEELPVWFGTGADGIYFAKLNVSSGKLTPPRRAVEVKGPSFLVLKPEGGVLYAVAREKEKNRVLSYRITEEFGLDLTSEQDSGGLGPCHVDITEDGKTVLVANYRSGSASSYPVAADGTLGEMASVHQHEGSSVHERRQENPHAHGFFAGPNSKGYVPDLGIDQVVIYDIEAESGKTSKVSGWKMPPGTGPRHLKFGKDGKQVYVLGEMNLTVVVGDLDKEGIPEQVQVIDVLPEGGDISSMTCSEIRVHPNGRFVYAAVRDSRGEGRERLTVFEVVKDGKLERIQSVPAQCSIPRNFAVDPSGKWLLVTGQKSNKVLVFPVKEDGRLGSAVQQVEVPQPMCVIYGS